MDAKYLYMLPCGPCCEISRSDRKDSSLIHGRQYIAVIRDSSRSADDFSDSIVAELFAQALKFARVECQKDKEPGRYRLDMNGPQVGTRSHLHIHIKLPRGDDKLAPLVAR